MSHESPASSERQRPFLDFRNFNVAHLAVIIAGIIPWIVFRAATEMRLDREEAENAEQWKRIDIINREGTEASRQKLGMEQLTLSAHETRIIKAEDAIVVSMGMKADIAVMKEQLTRLSEDLHSIKTELNRK